MNEIHWNTQLVCIMGAKGVGKSTLIKQYLKQNYQLGDRRVLYCSADCFPCMVSACEAQTMQVWMKDGTQRQFAISETECVTFSEEETDMEQVRLEIEQFLDE